jgi:hypothetical protein
MGGCRRVAVGEPRLASLAAGARADTPDVSDALPGRPWTTYLDLPRLVIPDLAYNPALLISSGWRSQPERCR